MAFPPWRTRKSEPNRVFVAKQLRKAVDAIQAKNPFAKIIIMGDFNDEPTDKAVTEILKADNNRDTENPMDLYNLMYDLQINGEGSYNYRGDWNMLDNLIVSNSLLSGLRGYQTQHNAGRIYRNKHICYKNKKVIILQVELSVAQNTMEVLATIFLFISN